MQVQQAMKAAEKEVSSGLGRHFADFIRRIDPQADPLVAEIGSLVVQASESGHVCLLLADIIVSLANGEVDQQELVRLLLTSHFVGRPGENTPLVIDDAGRLYLFRYWQYEQKLAGQLRLRASASLIPFNSEDIGPILGRLFPETSSTLDLDWQKIAVAVAFLRKFCVISGGPGTGKTTTVVKLLALLVEMSGGKPLQIALTAPTGKAAARLQESIKGVKGALNISPETAQKIPDQVPTIHRLLGYRKNSPYFRHDKRHPLAVDVLIVDEASMVDLALMAKLIDALPETSRLILLGDKDQLASVEAGRVLSDICRKDTNFFSDEFWGEIQRTVGTDAMEYKSLEPVSSLEDCLVVLEKSYRFSDESGIGTLAKAINSGHTDQAAKCFHNKKFSDLEQGNYSITSPKDREAIIALVKEGYGGFLTVETPQQAFLEYNRFRILCVHRHGRLGVDQMNDWLERVLLPRGVSRQDTLWYAGRPIMIRENDYSLGLFNGDTGITMADDDGKLRVFFLDSAGKTRSLAPFRLPAHQTAYAMTVHKSQGSEFEHVVLVLPEISSPLVGRELLYTAVTRAKKRFTLWGDHAMFLKGMRQRARRDSGLVDLLY